MFLYMYIYIYIYIFIYLYIFIFKFLACISCFVLLYLPKLKLVFVVFIKFFIFSANDIS